MEDKELTFKEAMQIMIDDGIILDNDNDLFRLNTEGALEIKNISYASPWVTYNGMEMTVPLRIYKPEPKKKMVTLYRYIHRYGDDADIYQTGWSSHPWEEYNEYGGRVLIKTETKEVEVDDV